MKRKKRSGSRTEKETTTKVLFMWWLSDTLEMKVSREEAWTVCLRNLWKAILVLCHNGGLSSMVRLSEFKSKGPWFDPLVGQGEGQFFFSFESTLVQTCLCLTSLCVYGMHPNLCTLNIPYPSIIKAGGLETWKHCTHAKKKKEKKMGSIVVWLLTFPRESSPKFSMHYTGTTKLSNLI